MTFQNVCSSLESCKGIYVQRDWLKACVEWIEQEEGPSLPVSNVREMVYEQWLHADLREVVSRPCIPSSVVEQQTTQITGPFIVQVDSLINVGTAAYAQLQKMKGRLLDDGENKKNFEVKPTRLLLMSLTDGVTDFQAMEYRPIPQINTELTPGSKLLLQGTLNCRLGTLLASGDHVQVLGGGVETLIEENRQKRVLARALKDESLAGEEGGGSASTAIPDEALVSSAPTHQNTGPLIEQSQVSAAEIEDLDLENFDDFEEMEGELHDAQEQWADEVECLREEEEEAIRDGEEDPVTRPDQVPRTVGQKWRPPSRDSVTEEVPRRLVAPVCMPGPSSVGPSHDTESSRVLPASTGTSSETGEREQYQHVGKVASYGARKLAVVPVRPLTAEGDHSGCHGGDHTGTPALGGGTPVVAKLSQTADVWASNPLVRVKAHFVRVTGKLKPSDGYWTVAVVIEDDYGGQLDVKLSNQVLERLIGFSAQEFVEHIQPNKRDPIIRARGSEGFKHCQAYLAALNCVMEIRKQSTFGDHAIVERLLDN